MNTYKMWAALISALVMAMLACAEPVEQPSAEPVSNQERPTSKPPEGVVHIVAKDKTTGEIIDVSKFSDVRQSGTCEELARESASVNPNLEFICEERPPQDTAKAETPATETASRGTPTSDYSFLVEYNLENGRYRAHRVSGTISQCEQMAVQSRQETPDSTFLCEKEIQSSKYDRYGVVLHRIGDQYFVGGIRRNETKGKLISEDDVETVIEYANCWWNESVFTNQVMMSDDQSEDDTVRRLLNMVPFSDNLIRDLRLTMRELC